MPRGRRLLAASAGSLAASRWWLAIDSSEAVAEGKSRSLLRRIPFNHNGACCRAFKCSFQHLCFCANFSFPARTRHTHTNIYTSTNLYVYVCVKWVYSFCYLFSFSLILISILRCMLLTRTLAPRTRHLQVPSGKYNWWCRTWTRCPFKYHQHKKLTSRARELRSTRQRTVPWKRCSEGSKLGCVKKGEWRAMKK